MLLGVSSRLALGELKDHKRIYAIIIVVIAISSIIGLIYANNRYWKIGHRIQKRRREKQEVRQRIIEQKKIELEIERRKREEQARDFSDAGKKIDDVYDSWKKKDKKNKH